MKSNSMLAALVIGTGFTSAMLVTHAGPKPKVKPVGIDKRVPWTTSRITGSPEPPPPYRTEQIFPKLKNKTSLFFDGKKQIEGLTAAYGLAFHPQFARNRYCYICYILKPELPKGTRVSRFKVANTDPPRVDINSEKILIEWKSGGHNGGSLKFGPDGCLYISTGDGTPPSPPDGLDTGQDITDLLASILRIDVDREEKGKPYRVPPDNPFVKREGARPEVWAYGLRNPWRMSFDRATGDLWLGDVGWQLWEMVYRIERAGNYGWSVVEGPQSVRPESQRGPTPILPPVIAHPRLFGVVEVMKWANQLAEGLSSP